MVYSSVVSQTGSMIMHKAFLSSPLSQRLGGRNAFSVVREVDVVDSLSYFSSRLALLKPHLYVR